MEKSTEKLQQPQQKQQEMRPSQQQHIQIRQQQQAQHSQSQPQTPVASPHTQPQHSASASTASATPARRPSSIHIREPLPTPPPDPRESDNNIFKFPETKSSDLLSGYQNLFNYVENQQEFNKVLSDIIAQDCAQQRRSRPAPDEREEVACSADMDDEQRCAFCQHLRYECKQFIDPLHNRLGATMSALLAAHGAVEQLSRLYGLMDKYTELSRKWQQQSACLHYVKLLNEKMRNVQGEAVSQSKKMPRQLSETEGDMEQLITLTESILAEASTPVSTAGGGSNTASIKLKHFSPRERSKSVMIDDLLRKGEQHEREANKSSMTTMPQLLRRQSTYSEGKSKVSKWTKVKAAFKWERANMPALGDTGPRDQSPNGIGLTPLNHEVARYLRVPSVPCGGASSADSILSSSSGHLLSGTGTPGTISSASSMDDIDSSGRSTMRRGSTKSDTRLDGRASDDADMMTEDSELPQKLGKIDSSSKCLTPTKSSSIKSLRRGKTLSDFEVLPEGSIADIKSTPTRKIKPPPSPLNLNLKHELNDVDFSYSPYSLKSPKDGTQSLNRTKKISSPGNSSVPSSPSRHSDFFAEFESEDLSSGDFSEPTTPSHLNAHKSFNDKQQEINQRYQMLRTKLDMEFEAKRREWEKMKMNTNACRAIALITAPKPEESASISAKLLEENLTPDFKKKLRKWRVKKQISLSSPHPQQTSPTSPNRDITTEPKVKIDWNLWKTGQLKLEGQGLTPLPDQKDLPEDFQKKLEQWNKIKKGGHTSGANSSSSGHDIAKRAGKHADSSKKGTDDERLMAEKEKRGEKHKPHEKDKLEKLAKLKAIVTDHPAKEIEVKTSEGVMKFEGISRKFTRKLYEWEKARGIGPESSTFALLHPGYRPLVVDRIYKDNQNTENSPSLNRSYSLDSIAPNVVLPGISQQASSLSLNDVNELNNMGEMASSEVVSDGDFKKYEEPEAVMVEVEDHIEETASPLVTAHTLVEQQTPIYKYEEVTCSDYCNTRRVQSFESHTNLAPLLAALQRTDEIFSKLKQTSPEMNENAEVRRCETTLSFIRSIYPYYSENLIKPNVLNAISDVQNELCRLCNLCEKSPLDEACCQETMVERNAEYNEELKGLHESLELLRQNIHGGSSRLPREIVPDINITTVDVCPPPADITPEREPLPTTVEMIDELEEIQDAETSNIVQRSFAPASIGNGAGKKKLRLRKMGSRQNSKTESDSTDEDAHSVLETPRRLKRKNFRLKQRSFDDDYYRKSDDFAAGDDVMDVKFVLKVKPGQPIEQCENFSRLERMRSLKRANSEIRETASASPVRNTETNLESSIERPGINQNANVFVKTKRKVFTTVQEPNTVDGIAVIAQDIEQLPAIKSPTSDAEIPTKTITSPEAVRGAKLKKNFDLCKSRSYKDLHVCECECDDERRCCSLEKLNDSLPKRARGVRLPLASDSFKKLNRSCTSLLKEVPGMTRSEKQPSISPLPQRKEHRYKKNTEKPLHQSSSAKLQGSTVKKIETKIAKTNSGTSVDSNSQLLSPDKTDNTVPRISRKLERISLIPTLTQSISYETSTPNCSEPSSPFSVAHMDAPHTPLTERAQRLLKAKEDFLHSGNLPPQPTVKRREENVRSETWEQYRNSDYSVGSSAAGDFDIPKSLSVDTITADSFTETPTQSDAGTDVDIGLYDSLPRSVSRSGKISSKLGFATLASKFRRGKGSKKSKETSNAGGVGSSALSALCRQTLMADVIAGPQLVVEADAEGLRPFDNVKKSQSSPQAGRGVQLGGATGHSEGGQRERERLNKSQSEQYVKRQRESLV